MEYCRYCDTKTYSGICISAMEMEPYVCPPFASPRTQSTCVKCVQNAYTDLYYSNIDLENKNNFFLQKKVYFLQF